MLQNKRVAMVTFEFGGCHIDSRTFFQDFWYFFNHIGYAEFYQITPSRYLVPIHGYKEQYEQFRTTNYLVILDEIT